MLVAGWEIKSYVPEVDVFDDLRLEPDGSITRMRCVHRGDYVDYLPADG